MIDIKTTIKCLRIEKHLTHQKMAERLHIARSTYSKIESGDTSLDIERLISISKVLDVPLFQIIKDDPVFKAVTRKFEMMCTLTYSSLSQEMFTMIPFNELKPLHKQLLKAKGLDSKAQYENTPLHGRIYEFGPRQLFRFMMENCGMEVLFERNLIENDYWATQWNKYLKSRKKIKNKDGGISYEHNNEIEDEFDEHDYFVVFIFLLKFSGDKERLFQFAEKDFPTGADEMVALEFMKEKTGALDGDVLCVTEEGYAPFTDIFTT